MTEIIQLLWAGLVSGFAYAMVGLSLVLIFKTARVLNFAAGTMAGFTGWLAHWWAASQGMPFGVSIVFSLIVVGVAILAIERLTIRPLVNENFLSIVTITLGLELIIANLALRWFGGAAQRFRVPGDIDQKNFQIGDLRFNWWHVVIAISTFVILGIVGYIVNRTELGLAMRAFAEDKDAARLMGIKESTVSQWTWVLSATVGGLTGIMFAPVLFLQQDYMNIIFIKGFVAAILGGFTSLSGAVFGGLLLGVLEAIAIKYAPQQFAAGLPVVIVFVILLIRPRGLLSRAKSHDRV
ncbi:MAG: branched-chain amino acid ABC transporter permease [Acidimicrobiales bacterium]